MNFKKRFFVLIFLTLTAVFTKAAEAENFRLATDGQSDYGIYLQSPEDEGLVFATNELKHYLARITNVNLPVVSEVIPEKAFIIGVKAASIAGIDISNYTRNEEGYIQLIQPGRIILAGNSRRATLYAVYDFLEDLGCRWYAPNFDFYGNSTGEFIPNRSFIDLEVGQTVSVPTFPYRAKRVEEGWSITPERLNIMIDWLAKNRHNVFNMTIDYGGTGRIPYENYRSSIIPEIQKRGLLLHVGGHNYGLFLPDNYFEEHPEWFGMNSQGRRVPMLSGRVNFNTANPEAVATFIENCRKWLREHPEIDLFSLVPEDSPVWDNSPESRQLGSIPYRHALFANQVLRELKKEFPELKVTLPAYQALIRPPEGIIFEDSAQVGIAMIRRDNTRPFFDISSQKNLYYLNYLWQWQDSGAVHEPISLGGYYRRYAFRSLPILNYSVLQSDLKYASLIGLAGLGEYGEPGDWFTFELIHYLTARLAWNCNENIQAIIGEYASDRFGSAAKEMEDIFFLLDSFSGHVVRGFGNYERFDSDTPFPELGVQGIVIEPARAYMRHLQLCRKLLDQARENVKSEPHYADRIENWSTLLEYLSLEVQAKTLTEALSSSSPYGQLLARINQIYRQMGELVQNQKGKGMFLLEDRRMNYQPPAPGPRGR
jgi:hypothetical protein